MYPKPLYHLLLVLLFGSLLIPGAKAQEKKQIKIENAEQFEGKRMNGKEVRVLKGNVVFSHEGIVMSCDSAYMYAERNAITAFGSIHINQNDSMHLYGKQLDYDGNKKYAIVKEDVMLQDQQMTLTTDRLDYDLATKIAFYTTGGTIIDSENQLTSERGYYNSRSHDLFFSKDVVLTNPQYTMNCDTLQYNIQSRKAFFHGPTYIHSNTDLIYCETGWYHTLKNTAQFGKNAYLRSESQFLYGDTLYYDRGKAFGKATGNIKVLDTLENMLIEGQYAEHYENTKKTFITRDVLVTKGFGKDSLYMTSDTIRSSYDTSGKYRILRGFNHVKVYNDEFQAKCDSVIYSFVDSTMDLKVEPVFWFGDYQATAERIIIHTRESNIDKADLLKDAFLINPEDTLRFSQIKGRDMYGFFHDNELYKVDVVGNGESIYYARDEEKAYVGMNKISSSDIQIGIADQKVSRINFIGSPEGNLVPIRDVQPGQDKLKGFHWRGNERPTSLADLRK